jgi:putative ABC transport system ATP-binding protein
LTVSHENTSVHGAPPIKPLAGEASAAPAIRCEGVVKGYQLAGKGGHRVEALRGVNLAIDTPGFYAIMGASGSGKSTLLHLLAALDRAERGRVIVGGRDLGEMNERELTAFRRERIGIVFQQFNLIPTLTARENVELPGVLAGRPPADLRARSTELLKVLGVGERTDHRPDALSGGEQQRVAIARALLFSPALLLADEPTGNLDSASSEKLWSLLADVAKEHETTVVMVTHEPAAAAHCSRVFVLRDGVVAGSIESEGLDAGAVAARYQQLVRSA